MPSQMQTASQSTTHPQMFVSCLLQVELCLWHYAMIPTLELHLSTQVSREDLRVERITAILSSSTSEEVSQLMKK